MNDQKQRQIERFHGREKTDHPDSPALLNSLPLSLWSQGPTDVGFCHSAPPVTFDLTDNTPIWQKQYPHTLAAEEGIQDTIDGLLASGVLESGKYRMAHDLRRVNLIVATPTVPVPNPYTALSSITPEHTWFSCIDLANAFFCLPLREDLRDIFLFTYKGRELRYTCMPQGFISSPGIFIQVLKDQLAGLNLQSGVVLIQYVDDILLAAPDAHSCLQATGALLQRLYDIGFKVSRTKLQRCRQVVSFLGRIVSARGTGELKQSKVLSDLTNCSPKQPHLQYQITSYHFIWMFLKEHTR